MLMNKSRKDEIKRKRFGKLTKDVLNHLNVSFNRFNI